MTINRSDKVIDSKKPSLLDVQKDVLKFVIGQQSGLALKDIAHLAQSSKTLNSLFQPIISAQKLVEHILHGEEKQAKAMLKKALKQGPEKLKALLTQPVTAIDYSGRTIEKHTALQAALGTEDDLIVKMILDYFKEIENGASIALKQWDEQFPETNSLEPLDYWTTFTAMPNLAQDPVKPGKLDMQIQATDEGLEYRVCINQKIVHSLIPWDQLPHEFPKNFQSVEDVQPYLMQTLLGVTKNGHTLLYDFSPLVAAINNHPNNPDEGVEEALIQFRKDFTPGVIKTGKHFNANLLSESLLILLCAGEQWNEQQCRVFSINIYGYLQRLATAVLAQTFATNFNGVVCGDTKLQRSMKLADDKEFAYFPLDIDSSSRLGFDVDIWLESRKREAADEGGAIWNQWVPAGLKIYVQQKNEILSELKKDLRESIQDKPKQELK